MYQFDIEMIISTIVEVRFDPETYAKVVAHPELSAYLDIATERNTPKLIEYAVQSSDANVQQRGAQMYAELSDKFKNGELDLMEAAKLLELTIRMRTNNWEK